MVPGDRTGLERRTLLASIGGGLGTALAGCSDVHPDSDDDPTQSFDPEEYAAILSTDLPVSRRPAPVAPSDAAVEAALAALEDDIATVPSPLTDDEVPNEAARTDIERTHDIAISRRDHLPEDSGFHRFRAIRSARRYGAEAAGAYRAVQGKLTRAEVEADRESAREAREDRETALSYVGDDRQRTLVLSARLEYELTIAENWLDGRPTGETAPALEIGEIASEVAFAETTIDLIDDLSARHRDRLETERSFESTFRGALERSLAAIDEAELPGPDDRPADLVDGVAVDGTPAERLLERARGALRRAAKRPRTFAAEGRSAKALHHACTFEVERRAFATIRGAVEDEDHRRIESVDDVRTARETALERGADSPFDPDTPSIGGDLLAESYELLETEDEELERMLDRDRSTDLHDEYAEYTWLAERIGAIPDAVAVMEERLERAA